MRAAVLPTVRETGTGVESMDHVPLRGRAARLLLASFLSLLPPVAAAGSGSAAPLFQRSGAGTTWVRVHLPGASPCPPEAVEGSPAGQTVEHVWCFEGVGGDSTWPANPGAHWDHMPAPGAPPHDGWHLRFDPLYPNVGGTCAFSDDWMWAPRTIGIPIPTSGFDFFLVTPAFAVDGWTGGVLECAENIMIPPGRNDFATHRVRSWSDGSGAWSAWSDDERFEIFGPSESEWFLNRRLELTPFLGPQVDSLQVAWELFDASQPGDLEWRKHGGVQFLVDNVSIGSFDGPPIVVVARDVDLFTDTFSLSDPAHTAHLDNSEQGDWIGAGGSRALASEESLSVRVDAYHGVAAADVSLRWRHDDGGAGFGSWMSKPMHLSRLDPESASDEGVYRQVVGADDGGPEDAEGTSGNGRIWKEGTTVEYYVTVMDAIGDEATLPPGGAGAPFELTVLPVFRTSPEQNGETYLLVDDARETVLDPSLSSGFVPGGGAGFGEFTDPVFRDAGDQVATALEALGLVFDRYDVLGAGGAVQCEPRGLSDGARGLGGFLDDAGAPRYDALIWIHSTRVVHTFSAASRADLRLFLDGGGKLFTAGDGVAHDLGAAGNGVDPEFLREYLGTEFPDSLDDWTWDRTLLVESEWSSSFPPLPPYTLYGECPEPRREFDRLTLAPSPPGAANELLAFYTNGNPADEGRAAMIGNVRAGGGAAVLGGFGLPALLTPEARVCLLDAVLDDTFGLVMPNDPTCWTGNGVSESPPTPVAVLAPPRPSPFAAATTIRFTLASRGPVRLDVYDVLGRRVRVLADGTLDAKSHERTWDGRDDEGRAVANGIYFVRLVAGGADVRRKVVRLR